MSLPGPDEVNALSRDELVALIRQLVAEVKALRAELDQFGRGARAYPARATAIRTAQRAGENVFQTVVNLLVKPVLHFLKPSMA